MALEDEGKRVVDAWIDKRDTKSTRFVGEGWNRRLGRWKMKESLRELRKVMEEMIVMLRKLARGMERREEVGECRS